MTPIFPDRLQRKDTSAVIESSLDSACVLKTSLGVLYEGDCLQLLPSVSASTIDTVFADPPFNLAKEYGTNVDDSRPDPEYVSWCKMWLDECVRALKPGGTIFV